MSRLTTGQKQRSARRDLTFGRIVGKLDIGNVRPPSRCIPAASAATAIGSPAGRVQRYDLEKLPGSGSFENPSATLRSTRTVRLNTTPLHAIYLGNLGNSCPPERMP